MCNSLRSEPGKDQHYIQRPSHNDRGFGGFHIAQVFIDDHLFVLYSKSVLDFNNDMPH
jgi:hypothetical protein